MNTVREVNEWLSAISAGDVLEIAAGSGRFTRMATKALKDYRSWLAIDSDEDALEENRKQCNDSRIHFRSMRAQELDFPDNAFDTIAISRGLHHLLPLADCITEMIRVLKPGGLLLVNEMHSDVYNGKQQTQVMWHHLRVDMDRILGNDHTYSFSRKEIAGMFEGKNLEQVTLLDYIPDELRDAEQMKANYSRSLDLLKGRREHPALLQRFNDLQKRLEITGIENPPHLFMALRKKGQKS